MGFSDVSSIEVIIRVTTDVVNIGGGSSIIDDSLSKPRKGDIEERGRKSTFLHPLLLLRWWPEMKVGGASWPKMMRQSAAGVDHSLT